MKQELTMSAPSAKPSATIEAYYTICPLLVASNIAVELGFLDEEFHRVGAWPIYLRSLENNQGWLPHFRHSKERLFRDGGAIPAIWAKADLTDTTLIATTAAQKPGQILVRADGKIRRIADLKGRRIGVSRSQNTNRVDVMHAGAIQGITHSLELSGLTLSEVSIVEFKDDGDPLALKPAAKPADLWAQLRIRQQNPSKESQALAEGLVDAIYIGAGQAPTFLASGQFTVIEDLDRYPDWTLKNSHGPYTTVVNTQFAKDHPQIVVAFLRASIRAGQWINANRAAAAELFAQVTLHADPGHITKTLNTTDFVPRLSAQNLAALELKKNFLFHQGYLKKDFSIKDWADPSFLEQAHASFLPTAHVR
jgi:ABC-type nitrate/sulfonate/bicarbonate transport system substrate-binding protein